MNSESIPPLTSAADVSLGSSDDAHEPGSFHHTNDRPNDRADRFSGLPLVMIAYPDGATRPAPFLMRRDEVAAFFRLHDSKTKFPAKTIQRYRTKGLRTVRVGRRVWYRLDDVLRFLDEQQDRLDRI